MKTGLFIVLAIIQVLIALIPTLGKLFSEVNGSSTYKITKWGKGLVIVSVIGLLITTVLYLFSEGEEENFKKELKMEREKSDSTISSRVDSNRKILFNDLSEALAKQSLRLDTVTKSLKTLRDSTKKSITIIQQNDPIFGVCSGQDGIRLVSKNENTHELEFAFSYCTQNSPYNVKLEIFALSVENGNFILINKNPINFYKMSGFEIDGGFEDRLSMTIRNIQSKIFFYLRGTYTNRDKNKTFTIDDAVAFDLALNRFGFPSDLIKENIKKIIPPFSKAILK